MASQLDAADKQQTLDWAAARQAWDQHAEALDTDAGERADGVTALESARHARALGRRLRARAAQLRARPERRGRGLVLGRRGRPADGVRYRALPSGGRCPRPTWLRLGVFLLDLAANREGRFLGIDYSEVAVAAAANVGQKRGLSQVRFCHADATRLEDLEERFGLVLDKGTFDAYMLGATASVDRYAASVLAARSRAACS